MTADDLPIGAVVYLQPVPGTWTMGAGEYGLQWEEMPQIIGPIWEIKEESE